MRIATNITALSTYNSYTKNNKNISGSVKKLSTGYQINSAADNAAGLAISEKMRAQIRGLEQASKNGQDAISMVQTAEGALQSTHDILQRMRELAVQSASDTNEQTIDRAAIQAEFEQLQEEINDIASKTRFNDQNLLDGTFQLNKSYISDKTTLVMTKFNGVSVAAAAANVYTINATTITKKDSSSSAGTPSALTTEATGTTHATTGDTGDIVTTALSGPFKNSTITFQGTDTSAHNGNTYTLQVSGGNLTSMTFQLMDSNGDVVATAQNVDVTAFNSASSVSVNFSGLGSLSFTLTDQATADPSQIAINSADDVANSLSGIKLEFETTASGDGGADPTVTDAVKGAIVLEINGESVTLHKGDTTAIFKDSGISLSFDALSDDDIAKGANDTFGMTANSAKLGVTYLKGKTMIIQSGANEGDNLKINIDAMNTSTLGISYSSVDTQGNASKAITEVNNAINKVSTQRSELGALQNRLEYKIANLDTSAENLTSAESLIRDVDMAKEMTAFTNANILQQAATAMLAQANALPQNVLSLLG